ncbi:MAG TPA: hypothetical protein VG711_08635 [Phycisphaerales bacterium]|nr:hypothetical protein [Phycisphaerales bacterium]
MRKWMIRIVMFTLIGAVVNVLVAWGVVLSGEVQWDGLARQGRIPLDYGDDAKRMVIEDYLAFVSTSSTAIKVWSIRSTHKSPGISVDSASYHGREEIEGKLPEWARARIESRPDQLNGVIPREERTLVGRGWPWISMWCDFYQPVRPKSLPVVWHGIVIGQPNTSRYPEHVLPLNPDLRGFAANTALYGSTALILWTIGHWVLGIFVTRRRKRIGRCVKCGYELRKSGVEHERCPECGAEMRK